MPAAKTEDLVAALDEALEPSKFEDYGPNGLQVPGPAETATVATGVTASTELFELAAKAGAGLLVVHHGLFWGDGFRVVDTKLKRRLELLFDNGIALAAYHLPLDAHPTLGNNALLADALGAKRSDERFAEYKGQQVGCLADLPGDGLMPAELTDRVRTATGGREPLVYEAGPPKVRRLAIVTGAGSGFLAAAAEAGADAMITGEVPERAMAEAKELDVRLIAAGHYATETFGIRALGEHLAAELGVDHIFLDVPNPV
ncbi:MAG TPA: Nif3-like dinuclear metal center hexameric protein [Solirubrobacteraceae bacterium]|nr:Nif3-like dinuclear metal center hexameric protein [Solirubrobacteraceae bacterium]